MDLQYAIYKIKQGSFNKFTEFIYKIETTPKRPCTGKYNLKGRKSPRNHTNKRQPQNNMRWSFYMIGNKLVCKGSNNPFVRKVACSSNVLNENIINPL